MRIDQHNYLVMKKFIFCWPILMTVLAVVMGSCGGVDQSDPKAVAEAALIYKTTGDYTAMKKIINPSNTYALEQIDKLIQFVQEMESKEGYEKGKKEPKTFTFKSVSDITDESTSAKVRFEDSEGYTREVFLEKEDGKWYVERVN